MPRAEIIENSGPNNMRDNLKLMLRKATKVDLAVAFVTQSGLAQIIQPLRQIAENGGVVRILTGLYHHVTDPAALVTLLRVQDETKQKLCVRVSRESMFHWKLYVVKSKSSNYEVIIGSSNLTKEGLRSNGELNAYLSFSQKSSFLKNIQKKYDEAWDVKHSVLLNESLIKRYIKNRNESVNGKQSSNIFKKILGKNPLHQVVPDTLENDREETARYWQDFVTGTVANKTDRIIRETTNWDEKHFDWNNTRLPKSKTGDKMLLFDFADKIISIVELKGSTKVPFRTPDGRHFLAYKVTRQYARRKMKTIWNKLKDTGLIKSIPQAKRTRKISRAQWGRIVDIFKK